MVELSQLTSLERTGFFRAECDLSGLKMKSAGSLETSNVCNVTQPFGMEFLSAKSVETSP
jgi:hypothetical protein